MKQELTSSELNSTRLLPLSKLLWLSVLIAILPAFLIVRFDGATHLEDPRLKPSSNKKRKYLNYKHSRFLAIALHFLPSRFNMEPLEAFVSKFVKKSSRVIQTLI